MQLMRSNQPNVYKTIKISLTMSFFFILDKLQALKRIHLNHKAVCILQIIKQNKCDGK